jgi:hypothetical protein
MDAEDLKSFDEAKRRIIKAICSGRLVVDEKGQPVFTPTSGDPITFHEWTGASLMAMDQKKKDQAIGKVYAAMADMTKQPAVRFAKMLGRDLKVCQAITGLFLGG